MTRHDTPPTLRLLRAGLPANPTADPPRPFDFLIDGELVRKSLEQHLLAHNLSAVGVLSVSYCETVEQEP